MDSFRIGIPAGHYSSSAIGSYDDDEIDISLGTINLRPSQRFARICFKRLDVKLETTTYHGQIRQLILTESKNKKQVIHRLCYKLLFEALSKVPASRFQSIIKEIWKTAYEQGKSDKAREVADTIHSLLSPDR